VLLAGAGSRRELNGRQSSLLADGTCGRPTERFINTTRLKIEVNNEDFLDSLKTKYVFCLAGRWTGFEASNIKGYTRYIKA
jgi:hypothetical protein